MTVRMEPELKKDLRIFQPGEWADGDIIAAIDASQTEMPCRPQLNVGILLWPEFPLLALAGLTDALRHAADMGDDSQKIRCSWHLMSATPDRPVLSSSGMAMMPDSAFISPEQFDYIVVIGGFTTQHGESRSGRAALPASCSSAQYSAGRYLYGQLCSGARRFPEWPDGGNSSLASE